MVCMSHLICISVDQARPSDESLLYLCRLTYRNGKQVDDESLISFKRICDAIKVCSPSHTISLSDHIL
jgi:hypothetical protein